MTITYKDAGVDVEKGDAFVQKIKEKVQSTFNLNVQSQLGGFSALYKQDENRYLAACTDGVGTKVKLAIELKVHHTIGLDLVAMSVNDLICCGATPLFFLDYLAVHSLDLETHSNIVEGITKGCLESSCALIGGETAEMSDLYYKGDYDLAGFAVGEVFKDDIIDGSKIKPGDTLLGLASSGFHSNGYTLIRKLIKEDETELKRLCLTPTKIYVKTIKHILKHNKNLINGMANITGGGFENIKRMNPKFEYAINYDPQMPQFMHEICNRSGLTQKELFKTFNMGIGFVIATDKPQELTNFLTNQGETVYRIGEVKY